MDDPRWLYLSYWSLGLVGATIVFTVATLGWKLFCNPPDHLVAGLLVWLILFALLVGGLVIVNTAISKYGNYKYYQGRKDMVGEAKPTFYLLVSLIISN